MGFKRSLVVPLDATQTRRPIPFLPPIALRNALCHPEQHSVRYVAKTPEAKGPVRAESWSFHDLRDPPAQPLRKSPLGGEDPDAKGPIRAYLWSFHGQRDHPLHLCAIVRYVAKTPEAKGPVRAHLRPFHELRDPRAQTPTRESANTGPQPRTMFTSFPGP